MSVRKETTFRILYLEDDLSAFELACAIIQGERIPCTMEHADTEEQYRDILTNNPPDLILADFNLPSIDGLTALTLKLELCPEVPFIFVSGSIGEEIAISSLKNGASDFVLKDALMRLPSAVRRALQESREHRERMSAEQRLRESEARFRRLTENAPDAIFRLRVGEYPFFEYISPAITRITGYEPEELYAEPDFLNHLYPPEDLALLKDFWATGQVPKETQLFHWLTKTGSRVTTEQRLVPVHDTEGRLIAIEGIARDITEQLRERENRRLLEAQLFQAQKLESIGTLAGGIAHDFNNILTGILGFTELASSAIAPADPVQEDLSEIKTAGLRAKELVRQILTFTRRRDLKAAPIDLKKSVDEVLSLVRATTPSTIEIRRQLRSCVARIDPTQLHQIILNLCTNAIHAMRGHSNGVLTVSVEPRPLLRPEEQNLPSLTPGGYVVITVKDNGHGMDPETLKRIFDPFFTTKGVGEGTGLGLALTQNIVANHGGAVKVSSQPHDGCCFEIYLPEADAHEEAAEAPLAAVPGNGERVAVLDDETSIANFMAVRLEQLNYQPQVFKTPTIALQALREPDSPFDILVTDYTMPQMTGLEVVRRLRQTGVKLPVVITSGDDNQELKEEADALGGIWFLAKPFTGEQLTQAVHLALGQTVPVCAH